jgi:hypothetical protein
MEGQNCLNESLHAQTTWVRALDKEWQTEYEGKFYSLGLISLIWTGVSRFQASDRIRIRYCYFWSFVSTQKSDLWFLEGDFMIWTTIVEKSF